MNSSFYDTMVKNGYFDQSPKCFWVNDMEWLSQNDIKKYSEDVGENITPFGITAGGDVWGIEKDSGNIILTYHDDSEQLLYADTLENAVFRQIVEYLSDADLDTKSDDEEDEYTEAFARKYIARCIEIFGEYFTKEQIEDIERIAKLPVKEYTDGKYKHMSFISSAEGYKIVAKYLPFAANDTPAAEKTSQFDFSDKLMSDHEIEEMGEY